MIEIRNRLEKNLKRLAPWAERNGIEAYRIYERDLPDYPFLVDRYGDFVVVYDRSDLRIDSREDKREHLPNLLRAIGELLAPEKEADGVERFLKDRLILKHRARQKDGQYEKIQDSGRTLIIRESQAKFIVNLWDYLDTGLFLDHRLMRQRVYETAKPGMEMLNLFSYTGSVSVFGALAGARVTSVDMSPTYSRWAEANFRENGLESARHRFVVENALEWLEWASREEAGRYHLIFLDPPTFSNSKRMQGTFDVERDQEFIVYRAMRCLAPGGILFFSNNKRGFKLSPEIASRYVARDVTAKTLPKDFRDLKLRVAYEIRARESGSFD